MKTNLLFTLFLGLLLTACSVDPIEQELGLQEINSEIGDYGCAGPDNSITLTFSEADTISSWNRVRKLYLSLLEPGVPHTGTFDPSIWDLINAFNEAENPLGEYSTTYYLEGDCTDSVVLTVIVVADAQQEPTCDDFTAGEDNSKTITYSEARAIESWNQVRKLYLSLLEPGIPQDGEFDPSIWDLINAFNEAENPLGEYTTTYTITDGDCSASVELTITVVADPPQDEPVCDGVTAGVDNSKTITYSEARALESWNQVRKLYLSLLEPGIPQNGEFDPSIWDLINAFNEAEDPLGSYTTTYTIVDGECSDSVQLTIIVIAD